MAQLSTMPAIGSANRSVCFDKHGMVLKMGDPNFIQAYANLHRTALDAASIAGICGDDLKVVTGPFSDEEYGAIRDCSNYILRSHALTDPRFSLS